MDVTLSPLPTACQAWLQRQAGPPSRRYTLLLEVNGLQHPLPVPRTQVRAACRQLLRRLRTHPPESAWRLSLHDQFTRQLVRRWHSARQTHRQATATGPHWAWLAEAARHPSSHVLRDAAYALGKQRGWPRTPRGPAD